MKLQNFLAAFLLPAALSLTQTARDDGYILRTENGTVCIFDAQTGERLSQTDTPAASLPEADRRTLEKGVYCGTFPELTQACEDYCS